MRSFEEITDLALGFRGSMDVLEQLMPEVKTAAEIKKLGDDRILALMARGVFQAGFSWKVIDKKWPGFEEAFEGFVPVRWKFMSDDDLDSLLKDTRIVRHGQKILSVRDNAIFLCDLDDEYGSAANCFADWPQDDLFGLLTMMKKRGGRLGGGTGQYFLRQIGKDSWVMSRDVVAALIREGVVDKAPTSKTAQRAVQAAFNDWSAESGRPFAHISRMLSLSIGPNIGIL
ncbi:MAG: DNA-3-methyladenine glycosylase I [Kordiimonadaceae bacterium]|nr:DNA-3-methyladenine glycosylase I [Kordiimonadaceae bacterium]